MPDFSPKQLAAWLLIAAIILVLGARALRSEEATRIGPGLSLAGSNQAAAGADPAAPGPAKPKQGSGQRLYVHVAGAVRRPGLYRLGARSRVADALQKAGGASGDAELDRINLAATISDGQQILVPRQDGRAPGSPAAGSGAAGAASATYATDLTGGQPPAISLSTATVTELETIDGIGPVTASKILEFRDSEGQIASIEELDAVPGIGPATMQTLRQALVP